MERFLKINWPRPEQPPKIFSLPESKSIWGEQFCAQSATCSISWVCNTDATFVFLKSGRMVVRSEFGSLLALAGTSFFVPPDCPHLAQILSTTACGWLVNVPKFDCEELPSQATALNHSNLLFALSEKIAFFPKQKLQTAESKRLGHVFHDELKITPAAKSVPVPIPHSEMLRKVAETIVNSPSDMKNINAWAKNAGMSRRTFTRAFLEETGLPFAAWRRRVKIAAAIHALRLGNSVADIAFHLGYQNPSTFNAVFKKQFGVSPSEYLKAQQSSLPSLKVAL